MQTGRTTKKILQRLACHYITIKSYPQADPGFFLGRGLKDEFIRMCIDCLALKAQLLK